MIISVPRFARSLAIAAALVALAPLPAFADSHDEATGKKKFKYDYPGWRLGGAIGYTDDVSRGAPSGFIGAQAGLHKQILMPSLSIGVVAGWYGLGDADVQVGDVVHQVDYSLIPYWGQLTWNAARYGDALFQVSAGAGGYNKRISNMEDCNCTDAGLNLGFGVLTNYTGKSTHYGAEIRYHYLPREDKSGNKYLTLMGTLAFDFGGYGRGE